MAIRDRAARTVVSRGNLGPIGLSLAVLIGCATPLAVMAQSPQPAAAKPAGKPVAKPAAAPQPAGPQRSLQDALSAAYANNPTLQAARATLRSVDENVPAALAGWHPTISATGSAGPGYGTQFNTLTDAKTPENRAVAQSAITVTQPIYRGGRTTSATNKAENQVNTQRAKLIAQEEQTFSDTVNAYVSVISATQILELNTNNEQVLQRQLQATNDRFRVGELTRTDVAQAEAALAGAVASRQTAEGTLQTARATYQRLVGELPGRLAEPQPLKLPVKTLEEAKALASSNNPTVVAALFQNASDRDNFDLQYAALMPQASVQAQAAYGQYASQTRVKTIGATILAQLTIPIYQGGAEYAAIRQARQTAEASERALQDARNTAVQQVISAWETYQATKSTIESNRSQIRSNEIALEGTEREALVGSRTTLDVLNAEQALLQSRTSLVQNLATLVTNSYQVASAVGRLTARDLNLNVPYYDETAYYQAVRNRWIGTGDFATDQPGR